LETAWILFRPAGIVKEMTVRLRPATFEDSALLLSWRNDPVTRAQSLTPGMVGKAQHENWYRETLASQTRKIFVCMNESGEAVGTIRMDAIEGGAELSWAVAPECRGRGYGKAMLAEALKAVRGRVFARIKSANEASVKMVAGLGFKKIDEADGVTVWCRDN
jgi:UDP-2,4-diacetamido-2,4,6-trideoxy-beta-L-altropyranose hydrolase